jgi:hypothetical protein
MNLLKDELIITSTTDNIIILTNHRIRSNNSHSWGHSNTTSIMLEKVSSIQLTYKSYPILLLVAGLLALASLAIYIQQMANGEMFVPLVFTIICVIAYFSTRKHVCVVASDGGARIIFETNNMKKEELLNFIDKIEQAKQDNVK